MSDQNNIESYELEETALINNGESENARLYTGKVFENWKECDSFMSEWRRSKGFNVIKDRVYREGEIIRRRTYICQHGRSYNSNSKKDSSTKKILCQWHVNASFPKIKNPNSVIFVNTVVDEHNHELSVDAIEFECDKKFSDEMNCTKKFRPIAKSLSNDAAQMSGWLDLQKEKDPRWFVAREWDDDNALTHLTWMTPEQVENWIQFSDCLLADETLDSHVWMFRQIITATNATFHNRFAKLLEDYPRGKHYLE
ncbi:22167_t:CDS:2, partial [Gigaspora rosea]